MGWLSQAHRAAGASRLVDAGDDGDGLPVGLQVDSQRLPGKRGEEILVLAAMWVDCQLTRVAAGGLLGSTRGIGVVGDLVDRRARRAVGPLFGAARRAA